MRHEQPPQPAFVGSGMALENLGLDVVLEQQRRGTPKPVDISRHLHEVAYEKIERFAGEELSGPLAQRRVVVLAHRERVS